MALSVCSTRTIQGQSLVKLMRGIKCTVVRQNGQQHQQKDVDSVGQHKKPLIIWDGQNLEHYLSGLAHMGAVCLERELDLRQPEWQKGILALSGLWQNALPITKHYMVQHRVRSRTVDHDHLEYAQAGDAHETHPFLHCRLQLQGSNTAYTNRAHTRKALYFLVSWADSSQPVSKELKYVPKLERSWKLKLPFWRNF